MMSNNSSEEVKPVYIFIKSTVSKNYKTKLSLCLGIIQLVLSVFMGIDLYIHYLLSAPYGHIYILPIFFFISALLSIISSQRPGSIIVICTLALAMMSILCSFCLMVFFGNVLYDQPGQHIGSILFLAVPAVEMIVSLISFSMCCQSLCCGYTRETQHEGQRPRAAKEGD